LHQPPAAVAVTNAKLVRLDDAVVRRGRVEELCDRDEILRVHEREGFTADDLVRRVAEDPLDRRADVPHDVRRVDDRGDVERVLDQRAKARLALAKRPLGSLVRLEQLLRTLRDEALELEIARSRLHQTSVAKVAALR